jgi:hypothetical protein
MAEDIDITSVEHIQTIGGDSGTTKVVEVNGVEITVSITDVSTDVIYDTAASEVAVNVTESIIHSDTESAGTLLHIDSAGSIFEITDAEDVIDVTLADTVVVGSLVLPGGIGGVTSHDELTGRALPDQHPIEAITNLAVRLDNLDGGYF